jgi:hypothetical protein
MDNPVNRMVTPVSACSGVFAAGDRLLHQEGCFRSTLVRFRNRGSGNISAGFAAAAKFGLGTHAGFTEIGVHGAAIESQTTPVHRPS